MRKLRRRSSISTSGRWEPAAPQRPRSRKRSSSSTPAPSRSRSSTRSSGGRSPQPDGDRRDPPYGYAHDQAAQLPSDRRQTTTRSTSKAEQRATRQFLTPAHDGRRSEQQPADRQSAAESCPKKA